MELRSRVIAFVEEGHGHRAAARHFRVSPRFVNDMVILKRQAGGLVPKPRGTAPLTPHRRPTHRKVRYSASSVGAL